MADADDVLEALEAHHTETRRPFATAPEIAQRLEIGRRRVLQFLEILQARGDVESAHVARGRAWWAVNTVAIKAAGDAFPPAEPPEEIASASSDPQQSEAPGGAAPSTPPHPSPDNSDLETAVRELEAIPGRETKPETYEERVRAVLAVIEYLRNNEYGTRSILQEDVYPDHPAGYVDGSDPAYSWWKNFLAPTLSELEERGVVELADAHKGRWIVPE